MPETKSDAAPEVEKKKKRSVASMQRELRDLARPSPDAPEKPPVDLKRAFVRVSAILALVWVIAIATAHWSIIPVIVAGVLTVLALGAAVWVVRYVNK